MRKKHLLRSISSVAIAATLLIAPLVASATNAKIKVIDVDHNKIEYKHSEKEPASKMDWKVGLGNYQKESIQKKLINTPPESKKNRTKRSNENQNIVTLKSTISPNEIHYHRFISSAEGTVKISTTANTKTPTVFITTKDGSKVYRSGDSVPAGEYVIVVKEGNGDFSVSLRGLSYNLEPQVDLPSLHLTKPAKDSYRIPSSSTSFTFEGSFNGMELSFGVNGSQELKPLSNPFVETISTKGLSTYNYYGFLATNSIGNSVYSKYEVVYPGIYRNGGTDAIGTSVNTSYATHKGTVKSVILVRSSAMADGVAGAALSGLDGAPILLTEADNLPTNVENEIKRLKPETVYILGGTMAITETVEKKVKELGANTVRFAGSEPSDTSAKVADYLTQERNKRGTPSDTVFITNWSVGLFDSASALSVSIAKGYPTLYVNKDEISNSVDSFLKKYPQYKNFVILGGTGQVSETVANKLKSYSSQNKVERFATLGGKYETNIKLIERFGLDIKTIVIGNGNEYTSGPGKIYSDIVVGAPLAAKHNGAILLTQPTELSTYAVEYLNAQKTAGKKIDQIFVQGGPIAVSDGLLNGMYKYVD
ncbi:putative cell wall-binding protein [Croceifilum oryzae]|uniref:Cell wall-binding protein n=1 Tax=Croceifilum oryzae TaxID=1553429 RepID=A0AAJ1TJK6_9BACL|nr:cell wall-binding repeat-containing protein [Croceifilum oryzae]MDQ0417306.1 putative cell wall-binding protein [Croceifilum oryzae]